MNAISVTALILAVGIIVVAFAFYGRGREVDSLSGDDARWAMLFATWRDSLIITLLFTAEGFLYRYSDFAGLSKFEATSLFQAEWFVLPVVSICLYVLIFMVAVMRVIALTRWLGR